MAIMVLLVNYDEEARNLYIPMLADNGITAHHAPNMQDALVMLVEAEYSTVVINGDSFDYLPLLKVMRKIAAAPIGVSVSHYRMDENRDAIMNGASIFRVRYDTPETRVERFSDFVKICVKFAGGQHQPLTVISCGDIQLFPHVRKVYVKGEETRLMRKEFDILHYLITNQGIILSYEQIYWRVWGEDYPDNAKELLWNQVYRLRGKLRTDPGIPDYIITERNYGYSFNPRHKAT